MRFMLLLYVKDRPRPGTPEAAEMFAAVREFHAECRGRGVLIASEALEAPQSAITVRTGGGELLHTDGPFAETAEWLGGYFVVECRDLDEAVELAGICPTARDGSVEVRPLLDTSTRGGGAVGAAATA